MSSRWLMHHIHGTEKPSPPAMVSWCHAWGGHLQLCHQHLRKSFAVPWSDLDLSWKIHDNPHDSTCFLQLWCALVSLIFGYGKLCVSDQDSQMSVQPRAAKRCDTLFPNSWNLVEGSKILKMVLIFNISLLIKGILWFFGWTNRFLESDSQLAGANVLSSALWGELW